MKHHGGYEPRHLTMIIISANGCPRVPQPQRPV
jgi:hypothetical protein